MIQRENYKFKSPSNKDIRENYGIDLERGQGIGGHERRPGRERDNFVCWTGKNCSVIKGSRKVYGFQVSAIHFKRNEVNFEH